MSPQTTLPATPRRSPRKHCTTPEAADGHMTKLLASYSLSVRREALRKAKEAAKKGNPSKMGFTMTAKLLPAIFTWEELASSRGQGLKSKEGDTRPVLDVSKMTILKEYVAVWCQQNGGQGSYAVNDAVTEQKMNGNCWWTERPTDSSKAISPPFSEGGHQNLPIVLHQG
uniref:Uncharacterized protein n=1 Tax=Magallana gigas TaxID=29159 RepID=K1QI87_MAGGI